MRTDCKTMPRPWIKNTLLLILLLLVLVWTSGCAGLRPRVVVIPSDRTVTFVKPGERVVITNECVIVGPALWRDVNELLAERLEP